MNPKPTTASYVDALLADTQRLVTAYGKDPVAPVAACPGWTVERTVAHTGTVHRWAHHCLRHAAAPDDRGPLRPGTDDDLAEWLTQGAALLAADLNATDPDAATWHPFPATQRAGFWPRRLAHETAIHRWDAEHAVGEAAPIEPELATDGIDEYFDVIVPMIAATRALPTGSLHVHCTDIDGEWIVVVDGGIYQLERAHRKGDAALRGGASDLLLTLWGRRPDTADISPVGNQEVIDNWLEVGGN